jgi:hypothetical protein
LLYDTLNGLIDTKVSWESFRDRKVSLQASKNLQGFELLYIAVNGDTDIKVSWESLKDRKNSL